MNIWSVESLTFYGLIVVLVTNIINGYRNSNARVSDRFDNIEKKIDMSFERARQEQHSDLKEFKTTLNKELSNIHATLDKHNTRLTVIETINTLKDNNTCLMSKD